MPEGSGQFRRRRGPATTKPFRIPAKLDGQYYVVPKVHNSTAIQVLWSLVLVASISLGVGFPKGIESLSHLAAALSWQFLWGLFGGCIMAGYRVYAYAIKLTDDSPCALCFDVANFAGDRAARMHDGRFALGISELRLNRR